MSWHSKVSQQGAGLHVSLQSETVIFDPDSEACPFEAIVRIDPPARVYDRGESTAHRGTLLVTEADDPGLVKGSKLLITNKVYMVDRIDRPDEGVITAFVYGNSQEYTSSDANLNRGR